jgi:hypothetical protein
LTGHSISELGPLGAKTSFDIAEAFAISELSKCQAEELIPAGKIFDIAIALVWIAEIEKTHRDPLLSFNPTSYGGLLRLSWDSTDAKC